MINNIEYILLNKTLKKCDDWKVYKIQYTSICTDDTLLKGKCKK